MGGWEQVGSHEVVGKGYDNTENSQMLSIGTIFTSTYHTKQLTPWSNSSTQLCGKLQPTVFLSMGDGAILRPPEHLWISDKPEKQATAKAAWAVFSATILI